MCKDAFTEYLQKRINDRNTTLTESKGFTGSVQAEKEKLTKQQKLALALMAEQVETTRKLVTELLRIIHDIKQQTINRILERDPADLALDVLMGNLKLPNKGSAPIST